MIGMGKTKEQIDALLKYLDSVHAHLEQMLEELRVTNKILLRIDVRLDDIQENIIKNNDAAKP